MNLKSVNIYGAYLQTNIQGYSIANSFTPKKAKTQFNILGPNLLLNSNRSFLQFYYLQSYTTPVPHPYLGRFPRNFKTLIFKPKLSFLMKSHKNDNKDEFLDFYKFTLYMIFKNFHENSHYRNGHFRKIAKII